MLGRSVTRTPPWTRMSLPPVCTGCGRWSSSTRWRRSSWLPDGAAMTGDSTNWMPANTASAARRRARSRLSQRYWGAGSSIAAQLHDLGLLRAAVHVTNCDRQGRVDGADLDGVDDDSIAQPLQQRALD